MIDLGKLIRHAVKVGASDIHLKVGNFPYLRIEGQLAPYTAFDRLRKDDRREVQFVDCRNVRRDEAKSHGQRSALLKDSQPESRAVESRPPWRP
ncbi:MAG: hypothetical protein P8Y94_04550 [Acidobacteriota bacterium]